LARRVAQRDGDRVAQAQDRGGELDDGHLVFRTRARRLAVPYRVMAHFGISREDLNRPTRGSAYNGGSPKERCDSRSAARLGPIMSTALTRPSGRGELRGPLRPVRSSP